MYSEEIEELLKKRNKLVSIKEYFKITESKQINYIKYENDIFYIRTNDNYEFTLKIKKC